MTVAARRARRRGSTRTRGAWSAAWPWLGRFAGELALPALAHVGGGPTVTDATRPRFLAPRLTGVAGAATLLLSEAGSLYLARDGARSLRIPALGVVSVDLLLSDSPRSVDSAVRSIGRPYGLATLVIDGHTALPSLAGGAAGLDRRPARADRRLRARLARGVAGPAAIAGTVTITGDPARSPDEIAAFITRVPP